MAFIHVDLQDGSAVQTIPYASPDQQQLDDACTAAESATLDEQLTTYHEAVCAGQDVATITIPTLPSAWSPFDRARWAWATALWKFWEAFLGSVPSRIPGLDVMTVQLDALTDFHAAGVRILPGTDIGVPLVIPGYSLHDELALFVEYLGMTPNEAIQSATRKPAEFFGIADLGTIDDATLELIRSWDEDEYRLRIGAKLRNWCQRNDNHVALVEAKKPKALEALMLTYAKDFVGTSEPYVLNTLSDKELTNLAVTSCDGSPAPA